MLSYINWLLFQFIIIIIISVIGPQASPTPRPSASLALASLCPSLVSPDNVVIDVQVQLITLTLGNSQNVHESDPVRTIHGQLVSWSPTHTTMYTRKIIAHLTKPLYIYPIISDKRWHTVTKVNLLVMARSSDATVKVRTRYGPVIGRYGNVKALTGCYPCVREAAPSESGGTALETPVGSPV